MPWRVRLVAGFLAFIATWWLGAALEQGNRRRVAEAVNEARSQRNRARDEVQAATLRLSEFQQRTATRVAQPVVQAELNRLAGELNRHKAAGAAAAARMTTLQRPWPYRRAWNRASLLVLLSALAWSVPAILRQHRAGKRRAAGLCAECGYDLRASPDRCPECGAQPVLSP
jgi:hypothetical protein